MMDFKRKQVIVLSLVLMIIVAGYMQYSYKKSSVAVNTNEIGKLGEAVFVDNDRSGALISKDKKAVTENVSNASKQANDFFAQAKLDKEVSRSKGTELLKNITLDTNASKESKTKAYDSMVELINHSDLEMRLEALIREKGFQDAIVIIGDDGSMDIIVKAESLDVSNTAQISDIVSRQANVGIDKIHIKNIF